MKQLSQLFKPAAILFGAAVLFSSCSDDMEPANNVTVAFEGTQATTATARMANNGLTVTEALLGIEKIELKQDLDDVETAEGEEEMEELEYDFEGPYVVDLLTSISTPEIPTATIQEGVYHKLEAEISEVLENDASISIKGTYAAADGSEVPVSFIYSGNEDFKVENPEGIQVTADELNEIAVLFDFNAWFAGVDFASAMVSEGGEIIIDQENNKDLYDIIEANVEAAADLEVKDDDDEEQDDKTED